MLSFKYTSSPKIVEPSSDIGRWLLVILALLLVPIGAWIGYGYGWERAGLDQAAALEENGALKQELEKLSAELETLRPKVAALGRSSQIDRVAALKLKEEIETHQSERLKMEEELAFLKGIVSDAQEKMGGLRIRDFKLKSTGDSGAYQYYFTLSRLFRIPERVTGEIRLSVNGTRDGETVTLSLNELIEEDADWLKMRFKHLQIVEGTLTLPQGFIPGSVVIDVKPAGKKLSKLIETFPWKVSS